MATSPPASVPRWFMVVALLAVVWNAFGVAMYLNSVGIFGDPMAGLSETERAAASSIPEWITGAFATGTFTGFFGSVGLLLRKTWAQPVLLLSTMGLLLLEGWIVFFSGALAIFGLTVPIMVSTGAILLAWLATYARGRGWIA